MFFYENLNIWFITDFQNLVFVKIDCYYLLIMNTFYFKFFDIIVYILNNNNLFDGFQDEGYLSYKCLKNLLGERELLLKKERKRKKNG